MPQEIERKFLVQDDSWRTSVRVSHKITQGYITRDMPFTVRIRTLDAKAYITLKSAKDGLARAEYEYEIPASDAAELLSNACLPPLIEKTRHVLDWGGHEWTVDVFDNPPGLVLAEIELSSVDQTIQTPPWAGRDVTDDPAYRNANLNKPAAKS